MCSKYSLEEVIDRKVLEPTSTLVGKGLEHPAERVSEWTENKNIILNKKENRQKESQRGKKTVFLHNYFTERKFEKPG